MISKRVKFALGGASIALAVLYLISTGVSETGTYYLTVSEAVDGEGGWHVQAVRVRGTVRAGSVDWNSKDLRLRFVLTDNQQQIPVSYRGVVPDLFAEGRDIIVEGRLAADGLKAESILASCPSKYEPQDLAAARAPR